MSETKSNKGHGHLGRKYHKNQETLDRVLAIVKAKREAGLQYTDWLPGEPKDDKVTR